MAGKRASTGAVGVVSTSVTGLQEVSLLLAREGVGVSRSISVDGRDLSLKTGGSAMIAAFRSLRADPATEIIVLISRTPLPEAADRVLEEVRHSDRPSVICFVGSDPALAWRAGAIPAVRLDEAAYRAAAWVRGWDQALVSSRLEDEKDQLVAQAHDLRADSGSGRCSLRGLFTSTIFCQEARLMLADVAGEMDRVACLDLGGEGVLQQRYLQGTLKDPDVSVVLLDLVLGPGSGPDPAGDLASILREARRRLLLIAHVCGTVDAPQQPVEQGAKLQAVGVVLAPSNATAARLAGMSLC
jgi:FdrA protein